VADTVLYGVHEESAANDVATVGTQFSFYRIAIVDTVDNDHDGRWSSYRLVFDVDATTGTHSLYARVYRKFSLLSMWGLPLDSTAAFTVTGATRADSQSIAITGVGNGLSVPIYDMKIEILRAGIDTIVVDSIVLGATSEENPEMDIAKTYTVAGISFYNLVDNDGDLYYSYWTMAVNVDIPGSSDSVSAELYYRAVGSSTWLYVGQFPRKLISGTSTSDTLTMDLVGGGHMTSEYRIRLLDGSRQYIKDTVYSSFNEEDPGNDPSASGYNYKFVNNTDAPMQLYMSNVLTDTIPARDSVIIHNNPVLDLRIPLYFQSIVATNNALVWRDTIWAFGNYRQYYYADSSWFLLRIMNNTNRSMNSVAVHNTYTNDSSYVYLAVGATKDIGFYPSAATTTRINTYYSLTTQYIYWSTLTTRTGGVNSARLVYLAPNNTLP
jgi:hypothetical protein